MRRVRWYVTMAILAIGLFVATNPVFAAASEKAKRGKGGGDGGNGGPGNPVLPEAPIAVLLPLVGIIVIGLTLFFIYRHRRHTVMVTE